MGTPVAACLRKEEALTEMQPRPTNSDEGTRAADEALRRDMQTINRAEQLLNHARTVTLRVQERLRRTLGVDPGNRHASPS
jgi:hypothetical protein